MAFPFRWLGRCCIPHVNGFSVYCKFEGHMRDWRTDQICDMPNCCAARRLMPALTLNSFNLSTLLSFGDEGSLWDAWPPQSRLRQGMICKTPLLCMLYLWRFLICWWGRCRIPHVNKCSVSCKLQVHMRDWRTDRICYMPSCCAARRLMPALTLNSMWTLWTHSFLLEIKGQSEVLGLPKERRNAFGQVKDFIDGW